MWNKFFLYTRSEQRGIVILFVLIILILGFRFTMPYWIVASVSNEVDDEFVESVRSLNKHLTAKRDYSITDSLFRFDINKVTEPELIKLGFSSYQRKSFLGYRNRIHRFKSKSELLKVYGVDSSLYSKLEDYIVIDEIKQKKPNLRVKDNELAPELVEWIDFNDKDYEFWKQNVKSDSIRKEIKMLLSQNTISKSLPMSKISKYSDQYLLQWLRKNSRAKEKLSKETYTIQVVELNTADTTQLKKLKGIGSKLSLRIIKFRNSLGGFYHKSQLSEVYGVTGELNERLSEFVSVDENLVQRLNPHKLKLDELNKHPYLNYQQAKELKNLYRKNKNPRNEDVLKLKSINDDEWQKIKPYLLIED